jgi:hypothetical protein
MKRWEELMEQHINDYRSAELRKIFDAHVSKQKAQV